MTLRIITMKKLMALGNSLEPSSELVEMSLFTNG
jgi:hypothetical protein